MHYILAVIMSSMVDVSNPMICHDQSGTYLDYAPIRKGVILRKFLFSLNTVKHPMHNSPRIT